MNKISEMLMEMLEKKFYNALCYRIDAKGEHAETLMFYQVIQMAEEKSLEKLKFVQNFDEGAPDYEKTKEVFAGDIIMRLIQNWE